MNILIIRKEFIQKTSSIEYNFKANKNFILNTCNEIPFTQEEIENGIALGLSKQKEKERTMEL